jgi:hypothetical protein
MFTFIFIILIVLLAAGGIFLFVQYNIQLNLATGKTSPNEKIKHDKSPDYKPSSSTTRWKAVRIKTGLMCCKAAERMRSQVYLSAEAPTFPLEGCKSKGCECKYIHMNDRRETDDRRESTEFLNDLYDMHDKDRRKIKDRRISNL